MNRINRKDRVLLESMNEKYGTDVVAQAILALSGAEGESAQESPQIAILDFIHFTPFVNILPDENRSDKDAF